MNPLSTRRPVLAICACATFALGSNAASAAAAAPDVSVSRADYGTTAAGQPVS